MSVVREKGRMMRQSMRDLQGSRTILYNTIITYLSKSTQCRTRRMNSDGNCGLELMMMCQCRFINCSKCAILVGDIHSMEPVHVWGREHMGTSTSTQFFCKPKIILKNKVLRKKGRTTHPVSKPMR